MIQFENHLGIIDISKDYFANLIGEAAMSCFGVAAMAPATARQSLFDRLSIPSRVPKGLSLRVKNQRLIIDLHIIVAYGTNISAIVKSIVHKVRYTVEDKTGFQVARVNVYIDGMVTK